VKKEIITITGAAGSGTSSAARKIKEMLGYDTFSSGDLFRTIAERRSVSLDDLLVIAEADATVDDEIDAALRVLGEESRLVIDSRIAFHWISRSFKVCLVLDPWTAAERTFTHIREKGRRSQHADSVEELYERSVQRNKRDAERYRDKYGIDMTASSNFDLIIDTGRQDADATATMIADAYARWLDEEIAA
jgi:cytidylate kinase